MIVSGSGDETIRLWNLDGSAIGVPFAGHTDAVFSVAFSPDSQMIVSGSDDSTIRLWNLDGSAIGVPFAGHTSSVRSVAFSPDGQMIVSGSLDNTIRLWNLDGSAIGVPFEGHTSSVRSVAFSPDGQMIVSGSNDETIRLWNLDGSAIGVPFAGHTDAVFSVAFSPDGQMIVSGSSDTTIRLWKFVGWRTWLQHCCELLHNNWSADSSGIAYRTCLMEKGRSLAEAEDLAAAIHCFQNALKSTPGLQLSSQALEAEAKRKIAPILIQQGEYLARSGNYEGAVAKFKLAVEFDDRLTLNAEKKAQQLTAPILLMQGRIEALKTNLDGAIEKLQQAKALYPSIEIDPEVKLRHFASLGFLAQGKKLVKEGKVKEAIAAYQQAQDYDSNLEITAEDWSFLCWFGSLHGPAEDVLFAGNNAVELDPEAGGIQYIRGLARALTGDFEGAIEDFEASVQWKDDEIAVVLIKWIKALKAGKNPFTAKEIEKLLNE
jgi:tetratricopeptide (TPR) repeat protein